MEQPAVGRGRSDAKLSRGLTDAEASDGSQDRFRDSFRFVSPPGGQALDQFLSEGTISNAFDPT